MHFLFSICAGFLIHKAPTVYECIFLRGVGDMNRALFNFEALLDLYSSSTYIWFHSCSSRLILYVWEVYAEIVHIHSLSSASTYWKLTCAIHRQVSWILMLYMPGCYSWNLVIQIYNLLGARPQSTFYKILQNLTTDIVDIWY